MGMKRRAFFRSVFGGLLAALGIKITPIPTYTKSDWFRTDYHISTFRAGEDVLAGHAVKFKGGMVYAAGTFSSGDPYGRCADNQDCLEVSV